VRPARGAPARRRLLQAGACACLLAADVAMMPAHATAAAPADGACAAWPAWQAFQGRFLREGGRVLDPSSPRAQSVSEAQGYALFFALVANDRASFERVLRWTEDNLAGGDLTVRLPAWQWGRRDDGSYGVIDENAAADADLWLAYALGEAGRLWRERRYLALSSLLAERIVREETAVLPGLGRTLLPGAHGFALEAGRWRLNPSYAPLFLMRWLATRSGDTRWEELLLSSRRLLRESAPHGFAPDWAFYRSAGKGALQSTDAGGFELDSLPPSDRVGSYNAIRVYLWLGITAPADPARAELLQHFAPMADLVERSGVAPESVDVSDGSVQGAGPAGFSAALLPFLAGLDRPGAVHAQELRLQAHPARPDAYYEQALSLFGIGWREERFAFAADGSLVTAWQACSPSTPSR